MSDEMFDDLLDVCHSIRSLNSIIKHTFRDLKPEQIELHKKFIGFWLGATDRLDDSGKSMLTGIDYK